MSCSVLQVVCYQGVLQVVKRRMEVRSFCGVRFKCSDGDVLNGRVLAV